MKVDTKKQIIIWISRILIITAFFNIFCFNYKSALADDDEKMTRLNDMADTITSGMFETIQEIMDGAFYQNAINVNDDQHGALITNVYNSLKTLGILWVIVVAMTRLFEALDRGQDAQECVYKAVIEIGLVCMFMINLDVFVSGIAGLGRFIIEQVGSSELTPQGAAGPELINSIGHAYTGDFWWRCEVTFYLSFPWILSWLLQIVGQFCVYQIILELMIRRAFTPIAVADIYKDGLRSPGARWLKKYLAVFIRLAICVLVCRICSSLIVDIDWSNHASKSMLTLIVFNFTAVGLMFRTGEFANDILGV